MRKHLRKLLSVGSLTLLVVALLAVSLMLTLPDEDAQVFWLSTLAFLAECLEWGQTGAEKLGLPTLVAVIGGIVSGISVVVTLFVKIRNLRNQVSELQEEVAQPEPEKKPVEAKSEPEKTPLQLAKERAKERADVERALENAISTEARSQQAVELRKQDKTTAVSSKSLQQAKVGQKRKIWKEWQEALVKAQKAESVAQGDLTKEEKLFEEEVRKVAAAEEAIKEAEAKVEEDRALIAALEADLKALGG